EGTLGLLISDPTLYEEMSMLLGGANRSVVLRTLVRMATDK
ncbi:MAG: phospholipid/cholesterol/gamma-HCH transport system substrate-binding protein, partial [Myxococcota bacterium]